MTHGGKLLFFPLRVDHSVTADMQMEEPNLEITFFFFVNGNRGPLLVGIAIPCV